MHRVLLALAVVSAPTSGFAGSVFLNGVNIDGVTNQTFADATVTIDAAGNILIVAKGYAATGPNGQPLLPTTPPPSTPVAVPGAAPGVLAQRYWIVTEKSAPGMTQYDIEVFVNSKFVRRFLDDEAHVVLEVTKFLQPGENKIMLVARKNRAVASKSTSSEHFFRIVIGEGEESGRNVTLRRKLVDYKRTAADSADAQDEFIAKAK